MKDKQNYMKNHAWINTRSCYVLVSDKYCGQNFLVGSKFLFLGGQ